MDESIHDGGRSELLEGVLHAREHESDEVRGQQQGAEHGELHCARRGILDRGIVRASLQGCPRQGQRSRGGGQIALTMRF